MCSRDWFATPFSSRSSSKACRESASSGDKPSSTVSSSCKLARLFYVDPVLGDNHLQLVWRAAQVVSPLAVEDLGVPGVGLQEDAVFGLVEDRGVFRELATTHGVATVDRIPGTEALYARRRRV